MLGEHRKMTFSSTMKTLRALPCVCASALDESGSSSCGHKVSSAGMAGGIRHTIQRARRATEHGAAATAVDHWLRGSTRHRRARDLAGRSDGGGCETDARSDAPSPSRAARRGSAAGSARRGTGTAPADRHRPAALPIRAQSGARRAQPRQGNARDARSAVGDRSTDRSIVATDRRTAAARSLTVDPRLDGRMRCGAVRPVQSREWAQRGSG